MGIFDRIFKKDNEDGGATGPKVSPQVLRLKKKVEKKFGQAQDRQAAITALADIGTEDAVDAMLQRFTFRIEQTIGDEEEKHMVSDALVRLGPVSIKPILKFLEYENSPYWPIKALHAILGTESTVTHLLEIIDGLEAIFDRDVERKVQLVSNLREFDDPRVRERLLAFATDENEELRVHAVEGLADLGGDDAGDLMVERLMDEDETQRVKTAVLNLLIDKKWKVKQHKEDIRKIIPGVFWIDDVGVIHHR